MAKKYVWLKLKEDFFEQRVIKKLRKIAGGDTYVIIYLKLQLLSLTDSGKLYFEGVEENFAQEMALALDEDVENVRVTLAYLEKNRLIECVESDGYALPEVISNIGSETTAAERMRKMRAKEKENKLKCNTVTQELPPVTNGYTEKEEEIDKDKEIDKDNTQDNVSKLDKATPHVRNELRLIIGAFNININELLILNKPILRIKEVFEWCRKNRKGEGYIIKALKNDWVLREKTLAKNIDKFEEIKNTEDKEEELPDPDILKILGGGNSG